MNATTTKDSQVFAMRARNEWLAMKECERKRDHAGRIKHRREFCRLRAKAFMFAAIERE